MRAFVVTADAEHFGRAAETLFLTQQALSKRIKRLEDNLSTQLFARTNRSVSLTEDGRRFLPHARALVQAADAAVAAMSGAQPVRVDLIDLRLAPMFVLRRLAERDPSMELDRSALGGLDEAIPAVERGELDVAFGWVGGLGRPLPGTLEHRLVRLEPLVAVVPPEHPLADEAAIDLATLGPEGIWLPSRESPSEWRTYIDQVIAALGVTVDRTGVSYDLRHTLEQARYGKPRVTLTGADMELPRDLNLRVIPFRPAPLFPWSIVYRKGRQRPAVRHLLTLVDKTTRAEGWLDHDPATTWLP
ncbi:LysR family transcriptional regulator [Actinocrispum sp. NPDC049592]|uniref:LysR family transcriptional regulator n=1 Tax=Actinocrispum sp. NPDC049592 TaxID=3154835 RepID=UPI00342EFD3A